MDAADVEAARLALDMAPTARVTNDRMRQARVLTQLSRTMLKANNPDRAAEIADDIAHPQLRTRMFSELIRAAMSRNDHTRVATLARQAEAAAASIPDPGQQAESLADLALAAEDAAARRFVALAFSTGRWTASLRALARVQPDTLLLLANEQMSRTAPL